QIEDKEAFLKALAAMSIETAKGPVKFDQHQDVIENMYIYQITKDGNQYSHKLLQTYNDVTQFFDQPAQAVESFPFGQMKGKWVGMTKDQVDQLAKG
ncbi:MAG TPA: hypothetical protein VKU60_10805, partial [Chloroflexota bacterium]|nr:hypothetical protein [Chloroflexota bacterium]